MRCNEMLYLLEVFIYCMISFLLSVNGYFLLLTKAINIYHLLKLVAIKLHHRSKDPGMCDQRGDPTEVFFLGIQEPWKTNFIRNSQNQVLLISIFRIHSIHEMQQNRKLHRVECKPYLEIKKQIS
ncbi:hypothetical protein QQP08_026745 [Theobroma cacao]|nr:hypothetical protein QQP08_026745 [Theobroma cacao]